MAEKKAKMTADEAKSLERGFRDLVITSLNQIIALYRLGSCTREHAVEQIRASVTNFFTVQSYAAESAKSAFEEENNLELVAHGHAEARAARWFRQTGKSFATGVSAHSFVVAVNDVGVGMAAAHLPIVTPDTITQTIIDILDDPNQTAGNVFAPFDHEGIYTPQYIKGVLASTIDSAMNEFAMLAGSNRSLQPAMRIAGGTGLEAWMVSELLPTVQQTAGLHPLMQNGHAWNLYHALGEGLGIIYSASMSVPSFYKTDGPTSKR